MKYKDYYLSCNCGNEVLRVLKYDGEKTFDICIYKQHFHKFSFWQRIKMTINYILCGELYSDQIIISDKKALELIYFLKNNIEN